MNIKDIAKIAGVSVSTVSKIVNGKDEHISPLTKEKVLQVVKEYNYIPYSKIKSSAAGKNFTIALLASLDTPGEEFAGFINQLSAQLELYGYHLLICNSSNSLKAELQGISYICSRNVDAVIWKPISADSLASLEELQKSGKKFITIGRFSTCALSINYQSMAYYGIQHLIEKKHRNIAFIYSNDTNMPYRDQLINGYRQCLLDHSLFYREKLIQAFQNDHLINFIKSNGITAVFTDSYSTGMDIFREFCSKGYKIPSYLSILSIAPASPEQMISTIRIPDSEFGGFIADLSVDLAEDRQPIDTEFCCEYDIDDITIDEPHTLRDDKIVVLGSLNIDTTFNIQHFPAPSISSHTTSYSVAPGGKGANHAVGVARFHHNVSIVGKIGNDIESDLLYSTLSENHVDLSALTRDKTYSTGKAFIYLQPDGANARSILDGANMAIDAAYIEKVKNVFENARYLIASTEIPLEAVNQALRIAKQSQCITILKPVHLSSLQELDIDNIDILVPNSIEASILTGGLSVPKKQAEYFIQLGIPNIVVTSWTDGCYLKTKELEKYYPPNNFDLIDSTGGSDAFISALASYLLYGYSLEKAVDIAGYAAGFCISRQGVIPALIDRTSLEIYINKVKPELLIK